MDFQAAQLADGFDEWPANDVPVHSRPFAGHARVTAGEFAALDAPALLPASQP